jgi:VWFA-related protein
MKRSPVPLFPLLLALAVWAGGAELRAQQAAPAGAPNAGAASQASPPQNGSVTTLTATARLVLLDVVVTDAKGKPVKGLKASDFTLLEDGAAQVLSSFQEHHAITPDEAAQAAAAVKLPPNHFTNYDPAPEESASTVILLDALDTPIEAQMYLREQLIAYMKTVPAGTKIAIFQLNMQLRMIQGFTSDPNLLLKAVESSKRDMPEIPALLSRGYGPNRQGGLIGAMQQLGQYLAGYPGRKNLIWFTARLPYAIYGGGIGDPFPDVTRFIDDFSKTTDVLTLSRVAVYPVDARGLQVDPAFGAGNGGGQRGLDTARFATLDFLQHADLDEVAATTGGKAFYNTNGLKQAIAQVVDAGSNYYTLSYTPANKNWDGSYRKLKLKLAQQGLRLEYRQGYYARNDEAAQTKHMAMLQGHRRALPVPVDNKLSSPMLISAMRMGAPAPRDLVFLANVTPAAEVSKAKGEEPLPSDNFLEKKYRKAPYRDYQIHYAVNARAIQLTAAADSSYHAQLEFVAVVYDDLGQVVNSKRKLAPIELDNATYQRIIGSGRIGIDLSIAIPVKGNYFLRMGVHDIAGNKVGALEVPVDEIQLDLPQSAAVAKP